MKPSVYIVLLMSALITVVVLSGGVAAQNFPVQLDQCQRNCGWLLGGGSSGYVNYFACIENCNRQFWKDFERETQFKESH